MQHQSDLPMSWRPLCLRFNKLPIANVKKERRFMSYLSGKSLKLMPPNTLISAQNAQTRWGRVQRSPSPLSWIQGVLLLRESERECAQFCIQIWGQKPLSVGGMPEVPWPFQIRPCCTCVDSRALQFIAILTFRIIVGLHISNIAHWRTVVLGSSASRRYVCTSLVGSHSARSLCGANVHSFLSSDIKFMSAW